MIHVIDAICGSGKSTYILDKMSDDVNKKYLYITPFLSEIDERLPEEVPQLNFKSPEHNGIGKIESFKQLVHEGQNVSATHKLFSMFTDEIVDIIIKNGYVLVIDEVVDCVGILPDGFNKSDTQALLEGDFVSVDDEQRGRLCWNEDKYPNHDGRYKTIRSLCKLNMLYNFKDTFLMWEYPPKLLTMLDEVYVLTYLFESSDMRCWLDLNEIHFEYVDTQDIGLRDDEDIIKEVRNNITLLNNRNLDKLRQKETDLSSTWFAKAKKETLDKYKSMLRSCVVTNKVSSSEIFWTTYKDHAYKLSGAGFASGVNKESDKPSFLPCSLRATNEFDDRVLCMYAMNRYKNPVEVNYLKENGVSVDSDLFALSELIQFVFRGCIRKNKPMKLFILSKRMRRLFEQWLGKE